MLGLPMRKNLRQGFWQTVGRHPYGVLLAALTLMMALAPSISFFGEFTKLFEGMRTLMPLSLVVVGASMLALWQQARHHALHMLAAGIVIVVIALGSFITHRGWVLLQLVVQILFLARVMMIVIHSVFTTRDVTGDTLCGSVCVYLLTGVVSGLIFVLIEVCLPGSFLISDSNVGAVAQQETFINDPGWLLYFSFVTLTTVGYGDVLPATSIARSSAVLVAVAGQVLLMVMIARLVGLHVVQAAEPPKDPGA